MKKTTQIFLPIIFLVISLFFSQSLYPQSPPDPPSGHGGGGDANPGGGAPIGGGLFILLGLGAAYGGKKLYQMRKESLED